MRKLIVTEFVSLDGVMQSPGGEPGYAHSGWVGDFYDDALGGYKEEEQLAAEILLLGRKTYDGFYGAWPGRGGAMADKINTMTKYVVSSTIDSSEWHDTTVVSDLVGTVTELKAQDGGPILVAGSRSVVHALLTAGLVDQLNLQVFPVILGSGDRVYPDTPDRLDLELVSAAPVGGKGVVLQTYAPQTA
jgi:dihydrofolate reductase